LRRGDWKGKPEEREELRQLIEKAYIESNLFPLTNVITHKK
jgi:hypothetical protein